MKNVIYLLLFGFTLIMSCTTSDGSVADVQQYTINQFMDNESIFGSSFSHDESKLLFGSNRTGIFNAYTVDIESGDVSGLTESEDKAYRPISFFPADDRILYISDNNGDEIDHIFVRNTDGTTQELTADAGAKAFFNGWAKDKRSFFYSYNVRDKNFFDMYEMKIDDFSSQIIYQNNDGLNVQDISRDKRYLALSKTITTNDADIFIFDTKTESLSQVNDVQGGNSIADFAVDNSALYYLSDKGSEFQQLMKYDIADNSRESVLKEKWDIVYAYFSESGKYQIVGINEDGKTTVKIFDAESNKQIASPSIDGGEITSVSISPSEETLAFYAGSSSSPSNLYHYTMGSGATKKLSNTLNEEINGDDLVEGEVIRFESFDGLEIPAILYRPKYASANDKVPAVVQVHGGPGGQTRMNYSSLYQYLVNHGYAVLCVNNRGSSGYGKTFFQMDDQKHGDVDLKDVIEGKNYLKSLDWIEGEKIGILGGSYGGYMVMRAMSHAPDEFEVGVNIFGVTNWLRTLKSIPPWWASFKDALYQEMGDPNTADSTRLYDISPLFHADQIKNPVIVLQGAQDPRVLQVESDEMVSEMQKNGVEVDYVLFDDEGHGFRKNENQIEGWSRIMKFLDKNLKGETLKD